MVSLYRYFDLQIGGVLMLEPEKLVPPDPDASWLRRGTSDGWTRRRRLERARADLERLHAGWSPTDDDLAGAPILTNWRLMSVGPALALEGTVIGHPAIGEGRPALTSALIALEVASPRWARTVSRFYRLDLPEFTGPFG